jgi:hypothetical protein
MARIGRRGEAKAQGRSLAELLYRQPAAMKKAPRFAELVALLNGSPALRRLILVPRSWRLLALPRLRPENLVHFYQTYRLPPHEFFSGFLELKWAQLEAAAARRAERTASITAIMRGLAPEAVAMLEWLKAVEARANANTPLWSERFEPRSKKRARELAALDDAGWHALFAAALGLLSARYPALALPPPSLILDYWALGCLPDPGALKRPDAARLRGAWREASKRCHPDAGGDPARFRVIDEARRRLGL